MGTAPQRSLLDTVLSMMAHLKGAPLLCEEWPLGAVPGNAVIQVRQLELCKHLRHSHAASPVHTTFSDVCAQPWQTIMVSLAAQLHVPWTAVGNTGAITCDEASASKDARGAGLKAS